MSRLRNYISALAEHFPVTVVRLRYLMRFGKLPNLRHPQNLNEKILHQKLYSDTSQWTELADKVRVRDYVKACGLEHILIPFYGAWERAEDIPFGELPENFMLKSNNGDGRGTFMAVRNKSALSGADIANLRQEVKKWLSARHIGALSAEPQYRHIPPKVMAEELLPMDKNLGSIVDYKLWCFNGEPHSFLICSDRQSETNSVCLASYDLAWQEHPERMNVTAHYAAGTKPIPRPRGLEEMIRCARILSKPFPQVRVDFYDINGKVYFGELTFTSQGGMMEYYTPEALTETGRLVTLQG